MTADVWCARREGGEETFARKMGAVSKVAQQLSHAACPTSTCSWTDFVDMLRTSKLWILGGPLMGLHCATAFNILGVVGPPPPTWLPQRMVGSMDMYVLACKADGFTGIGQLQFVDYLRDLSRRSHVLMSELENMCCQLKAFGDASGW